MASYNRIILIGFFISLKAFALSLSIEKQTSEGLLQKAISITKSQSVMTRNTNYFDKDTNSIGKYKVTNSEKIENYIKELDRLSKALDKVSSKLPNNSALKKPKHEEAYLRLNKYYITSEHPMFKEIDQAISKVFGLVDIDKVDTIEVKESGGFLQEINYKDGISTKQRFDSKKDCVRESRRLRCKISGYGTLFLK